MEPQQLEGWGSVFGLVSFIVWVYMMLGKFADIDIYKHYPTTRTQKKQTSQQHKLSHLVWPK